MRSPGGTVARLSAVISVDQLHGYAFVVLAPEIARGLHASTNHLAAIGILRGVGFVTAAAVVERLVRRGRARRVTQVGAAARAGALAVGGIAASGAVAGGLLAYGAAGTSVLSAHRRLLAPPDRETHRLAGRLGNAVVPLVVAGLAYVISWQSIFLVMAVVAGAIALTTIKIGTTTDTDDEMDVVLGRLGAVPGGRLAIALVTAASLTEFPIYVVVFAHLGTHLHMSILARAGLIAAAELAGVVANLMMSRRMAGGRTYTAQSLGVAITAVVFVGFAALALAMTVTSVALAVAALFVGALAISVMVPFMALGTRAVLADAVPRWVTLGASAAFGAVLVLGGGSDAATVGILLFVPVCAVGSLTWVGLRSPEAVADGLRGVANVTPADRIVPAPPALEQA